MFAIDIIFSITLAITAPLPPTTTHCDIFLDDQGQTFEVCWEEGETVVTPSRERLSREARER
jgi:hypothetical protein